MNTKIKSLIFSFALLPALIGLLPVHFAQAANDCSVLEAQIKILATNGAAKEAAAIQAELPKYCTAQAVILKIINVGLGLAGSVAIIFIIVGGFWYLGSAGSETLAKKGKQTLMYAILGLAVVILSAAIVNVLANLLVSGQTF